MRWPFFGLLGLVAIGALVVLWQRDRVTDEAGVVWQVVPVERRDLVVSASATGLIEPLRAVEVKSKASGEIIDLRVETGDQVDRGTLLVQLDREDAENQLRQTQADLDAARARLQVAESRLRRAEELHKSELLSTEDLEAAVLEAADSKAQVIRSETNLRLAQERLRDTTVRAPITGTVVEKNVEGGQIITSSTANVGGGTTLLVMADLREVNVRTQVDETDIGRVRPGQEARVRVEAYPERTFLGIVEKIEPQAVVIQNVTTFSVLVRLKNEEGLLLPGMNADVEIVFAERPDVLTVPNEAVKASDELALAAMALGLDPQTVRERLGQGEGGASGRVSSRRGNLDRREGEGNFPSREMVPNPEAQGDREPGSSKPQPAVVFVQEGGSPRVQPVLIGARNWDESEVVSGLSEGMAVYLLPTGSLQAQREELLRRFRRFGGVPGMRRE